MSTHPSRLSRFVAVCLAGLVLLLCLGFGPCGPIPGGRLSGEESLVPVDDWSFVDAIPRCAVEVRPDSPYSVTTNCMSWQGRLFISCSNCEPKKWARYALEDPTGRVRIGDHVYPVMVSAVENPAVLDAVWMARANKVGSNEMEPRPDAWATFEMVSRAP